MELAIYILIYILTIILIIFPKIIREKYFPILWFFIAYGLSIIIRSSIGDGNVNDDILVYTNGMKGVNFIWTPNYLREFIFWYPFRSLYNLFKNEFLVWGIYDSITFILLYKGFTLNRKGFFPNINNYNTRYIFFALFLFFPYTVGMHVIYRQLIATVFFMCAIGYTVNKKLYIGFLIFLISIFIHNSVAIFTPLILFMSNRLKYKSLSIILIIVMPLALSFSENTTLAYLARENIYYKETLTYTFLFFLYFIIGLVFILNNFKTPNRYNNYSAFSIYLFIVSIIYGISFYNLNSSLSIERIAIFIFAIIFPLLAYYIEDRFSNKVVTRLLFFNIAILPLFIFYTSLIKI